MYRKVVTIFATYFNTQSPNFGLHNVFLCTLWKNSHHFYPNDVNLLLFAVDKLIASATGIDFINYILMDLKIKKPF